MLTDEQRAAKATGIGGSQIAAICGLDPHGSPLLVYCEIVGLWHKPSSAVMDDGNRMEPVIAGWYAERHPDVLLVEPGVTFRHADEPWVLGHPDRLAWSRRRPWTGAKGKWLWGLEIKRRYNTDGWGVEGTDDIPLPVICQVQWYMFVTGLRRWDVAVRFEGAGYREYRIEADADLQADLLVQGRQFWQLHIEPKVPPYVTGNAQEGAALAAVFPFREDRVYETTPAEDDLAVSLVEAQAVADEANATLALRENQMRAAISERGGVRGWWGQVTWKADKRGRRTLRKRFKEIE